MISEVFDRYRRMMKRRHERAVRNEYENDPGRKGAVRGDRRGRLLRSVIYGGLDGIVTTFAVVAGVAGASLTVNIVLIMGAANLLADGISMAIGDFLSSRAEGEYEDAERVRERLEVDRIPDVKRSETAEGYIARGVPEKEAREIAQILSRHPGAMADTISAERATASSEEDEPLANAAATFLSFCFFGLFPLLSFILARFLPFLRPCVFPISAVLTGGTLFVLGALKVLITLRNWLISGAEMLAVGGLAAIAAWVVGRFLSGLS